MAVLEHLRPVLPWQVVMQPQYQSWMRTFGAAAQHLVVNQQAAGSFPVLTSACSLQVRCLCVLFLVLSCVSSLLLLKLSLHSPPRNASHEISSADGIEWDMWGPRQIHELVKSGMPMVCKVLCWAHKASRSRQQQACMDCSQDQCPG